VSLQSGFSGLSGNRKRDNLFLIIEHSCMLAKAVYVQFQQGEVGVAVVGLGLALLRDIFLEDRGRFRVVPVQAVQYRVDVRWPLRRMIKCEPHRVRGGMVQVEVVGVIVSKLLWPIGAVLGIAVKHF